MLQVVNGGASVTPNLARRLLRRLDKDGPGARHGCLSARSSGGLEALSAREREILRLVAVGHTSSEIGVRLSISAQTVNSHIKNVYRKLQVRSRAQAVTLASTYGILY